MVSLYMGYLPLPVLFCLLTPTLQLTVAVLTGNKWEGSSKLDRTSAGSASNHNNVILETRCHMKSYPNGKIYNCSSASPSPSSSDGEPSPQGRISQSQKKCASNSRLVGDRCLCNSGFKQFPFSEVCVKGEGERCQFQKNECSTDMTYMACINNVCACEDIDFFDSISFRCLGKIGGLCYPDVKECVANAECVNIGGRDTRADLEVPLSSSSTEYVIPPTNDIELSGRCECREGYVEDKDGFCKKGFGLACKSQEECDSPGLVCKEGVCSCRNSLQVYDLAIRSCVNLVGAHCSDSQVDGTSCVKYAYCEKTNLKLAVGRCACMENTVETRMRTCNPISSMSTSILSTQTHTMGDVQDNKNEESSRILFMDY